jgi:hypothetical protein
MRWEQIKNRINDARAKAAVATHNEFVDEIMADAELLSTDEADKQSNRFRILKSDIQVDEQDFPIEEIENSQNPLINAENKRLERLKAQKKNADIRKKQLKIRDQQKALMKLRKGSD